MYAERIKQTSTYIVLCPNISHKVYKLGCIEIARSEMREEVVVEEIFSINFLVVVPYSRGLVCGVVLPIPVPFRVLCSRNGPCRYGIDACGKKINGREVQETKTYPNVQTAQIWHCRTIRHSHESLSCRHRYNNQVCPQRYPSIFQLSCRR